ncbi:MAG: MOSC domain-containing protein [Bacteroidota bacterium]
MPKILAVHKSATHTLNKYPQTKINLLKGLGVDGDAHQGKTVKHRSRVKADPTQPNLRQVHLIHFELLKELKTKGFSVLPGEMGENITTQGIELLSLSKGTKLKLGETAIIEITGLRNPCVQLEGIQKGLMKAVLDKDADGNLVRKAGIMAVVQEGGEIKPGDNIQIEIPEGPFVPLKKV